MTEEKKVALRKSMAGKKVSELNPEEREFYDTEYKYKLAISNKPLETPAVSDQTPDRLNLPLTMKFLSKTALLSSS